MAVQPGTADPVGELVIGLAVLRDLGDCREVGDRLEVVRTFGVTVVMVGSIADLPLPRILISALGTMAS
jgi:hypothetical protein